MRSTVDLILFFAAFVGLSESVIAEQMPLTSLHGTMIMMLSKDEGIPIEIWAKGDDSRGEYRTNGVTIVTIQRDNKVYTYVVGERNGEVNEIDRRSLGSKSLIKQIEEVMARGTVEGSETIDGELCDVYHYKVNFPAESAVAYLSRKTSLPRFWISAVRTDVKTAVGLRIIYRDMEAGVEIPDPMFQLPRDVEFKVVDYGPFGFDFDMISKNTGQTRNDAPAPEDLQSLPDDETLVVVASPKVILKTETEDQVSLLCGDVVKVIERRNGEFRVMTPKGLGWIRRPDVVPMQSAYTYFTTKLQTDPGDVTALFGLASLKLWIVEFVDSTAQEGLPDATGLLDLALEDFNRLIAQNPTAEAFSRRGHAFALQGNFRAAFADLNTAIQMDPKNIIAIRRRADVNLQLDRIDSVLSDSNTMIQFDPKDANAHSLRCFALALKGEIDEAMLECNEAIEIDPNLASAYMRRGTLWAAMSDDEKAKADYDAAVGLGDETARGLRARILYQEEKFTEAIADLDFMIKLHPEDSLLYSRRGLAWLRLGELDKAIEDFSSCLQIDPSDFGAITNRAIARLRQGDDDKALEDFSHAIKLAPEHPSSYSNRAQLYAERNEYELAIADLTSYIQLNPNDPSGYADRGSAHYFINQHEQAIADFDSAIELEPDVPGLYLFRGSAKNSTKDHRGAIDDFTRVIELNPEEPQAYTYRGAAWNALDEPKKAIADFDSAVKLDPTFDLAWINRGSYWQSHSEYAKAIADWKQAWRLNPNRAELANELAQMLATCPEVEHRDLKRSIELAERACDLSEWSQYEFLATLATAYAESGDFESAANWLRKSLEVSPVDRKEELQTRLERYVRGEKPPKDASKQ